MPDINEAPLKVTFKTPLGTFVSATGNNADELAAGVAAVVGLLDPIIEAETLFGPAQNLKSMGATAVASPTQAPPAPTQAAPTGWGSTPSSDAAGAASRTATPTVTAPTAPLCDHNEPAKYVAGGISRSTNRPYQAFWACARQREYQCKWRQNG